jgi:hypothetical protein
MNRNRRWRDNVVMEGDFIQRKEQIFAFERKMIASFTLVLGKDHILVQYINRHNFSGVPEPIRPFSTNQILLRLIYEDLSSSRTVKVR